MKRLALAVALVVGCTAEAAAEWQFKPALGLTFGTSTTLLDLAEGTDKTHTSYGGSVVLLGDILGVEADFGYVPGFFQRSRTGLVLRSSALTLTGSVVATLPRRIVGYSLRPYVVGGFGLLRARTDDAVDALSITENLPAITVGGGVTGFFSEGWGVSWDLRYFRSVGQPETAPATSIGSPQLSFWRANVALAFRY